MEHASSPWGRSLVAAAEQRVLHGGMRALGMDALRGVKASRKGSMGLSLVPAASGCCLNGMHSDLAPMAGAPSSEATLLK